MDWLLSILIFILSSNAALGYHLRASILQLPTQTTPTPSPHSNITTTPGKWPPLPHGRIDITGPDLYIDINSYGRFVSPFLLQDVTANLALIVINISRGGNPDRVMPNFTFVGNIITFRYTFRRPFDRTGIRRRDLIETLEMIGGLMLIDGIREVGAADIYRMGINLGTFSLNINVQ